MASDRGTLPRSAGLSADQGPWAEPTAPSGRRLPSAPRERKPALFALAILLVAAGAGAAGLLVIRAGTKVQAIEIVQQVNQNAQIPAGAMEEVEGKYGRYAQCVDRDCRGRVNVAHGADRKS